MVPALQPYKTHQPTSFPGSPRIHSFYDDPTATWTFVVADPATLEAIIVDPVLDFDPVSGRISQKSVQGLAGFVQKEGYKVVRICETHVHADHLTGAYALKQLFPGQPPVFIGARVVDVQKRFAPEYGLQSAELDNAFDGFMQDGESFKIGSLTAVARSLPGHTPDSMGILIGDAVFAGDSLFLYVPSVDCSDPQLTPA
ncbi:hypothetical protein QFC21_000784 [Naganishia friedmannii]|uniref:Uncharacterized protein n=1 Tax=Naganishia friedmannii TaxID=89922 RepID=A0ACC2W6G2_9TREE|nr:hypothetical protein QFC21_000784 [Naganishia friedmannii]